MRKIIFIITAFFIAPQISFADTLAQDFSNVISGTNTYYNELYTKSSVSAPAPLTNVFATQSFLATSTYRLSRIDAWMAQPYNNGYYPPADGYITAILYEDPTYTSVYPIILTSWGTPIATSTSVNLSSLSTASNQYGYWGNVSPSASSTSFVFPGGVNIISNHKYVWVLKHSLASEVSGFGILVKYQFGGNGSLGTNGLAFQRDVYSMEVIASDKEYYFQTYQSSSAPDSLTLTAPYPQTYIQNPITFIGSYHSETICYKEITVEVQSITQAQTLIITPFSFYSCPANPDQTFSFDRTLPYTGQYRARVKLTAFNDADSLPWSPWHEFDLGQVDQGAPFTPQGWTPETCDTLDLPCHIRNAFGVTFYPSIASQETLSSTLSADNLKYRFPLGYVTDFVTIISTSTESSLVVVDATLPSVLPGGGAHIHIDLSHILDPVLNATSTIFNNASAPSTQTFYEITAHYWNIILYLAVVFYVIARIVGSHIVPDLGHMNTDTQDMRAKSFNSAEEERYRYKESLYKNSYQGRGGYGPFLSDKNKLR